jgi:hypothetical protein
LAPPELVVLAGFHALEPFALALTEEPRLPVVLAQALLPETDVVVIMIVDEPLLAVALFDTPEPAAVLPAPKTKRLEGAIDKAT